MKIYIQLVFLGHKELNKAYLISFIEINQNFAILKALMKTINRYINLIWPFRLILAIYFSCDFILSTCIVAVIPAGQKNIFSCH